MKLRTLLPEILNTFHIQMSLLSDPEINITQILDQIRGVKNITTLNNITPQDYNQKENVEFTKIEIKFITRNNPKDELERMKDSMLHSDIEKNHYRIEGLLNLKWDEETLHRI